MSSDEVDARLAAMFNSESEDDGDEEFSSYSEDESIPETIRTKKPSCQEERWSAEGSLHTFPFQNIGHFNIGPAESPIDFFNLLFNSTFLSLLETSINTHALRMLLESEHQHSRALKWRATNAAEIRVFLALIFHMGHIRLNRLNDYWSSDPLFDLPFIKSFMSRDRFQSLLGNLTVTDPDSYSNTDLTGNVKPIIDFFNAHMKSLISPPKNLTIDESIILFRGRLKIRQYNKGKRHKYGVKMYILSDTNGITQKMHMYCGSGDVFQGKGHADKVVMWLMEDYLNAGHSLYMDNFYNSVTLAETLLDKLTYVTGTLKANRFRNPQITKSRVAPGTVLSRYNSRGVCVSNYRDKRNVLMISTEHQSHLVDCRNSRGRVTQKPKVIAEYNKYMKGVDRKDQMLSYYPFHDKSIKWYKKVILHVVQVMLLNAFMMFNQQMKLSGDNKKVMNFLDFRINLVKTLLAGMQARFRNNTPTSSTGNRPTSSTRGKIKTHQDDDIHLPEKLPTNSAGKTKRKDCRQCSKRNIRKATTYYCPLCYNKPGLCLTCFRHYHDY